MGDLFGLKGEGGKLKITHEITQETAIKIGLALFGSSLAILIISTFIKAFSKK